MAISVKQILSIFALSTTVFAGNSYAGTLEGVPGEFGSYATLVSEYSFRGIAQSDETPALQGGIDWSHESGAYLGIWGSSVDFNDGDEASSEIDFFGGYGFSITDKLTADIGGIYYAYPGADSSLDYDFIEAYGSLSYDFDVASLSASYAYSPEFFGGSGDAHYVSLSTEVPLPYDLALYGHLGRQYIEEESVYGVPDYNDWELGLQWQYDAVALNLSYVDTSLSTSECADGCSERVIAGVSVGF